MALQLACCWGQRGALLIAVGGTGAVASGETAALAFGETGAVADYGAYGNFRFRAGANPDRDPNDATERNAHPKPRHHPDTHVHGTFCTAVNCDPCCAALTDAYACA